MAVQAGYVQKKDDNIYIGQLNLLTYQGPIELRPCESGRNNKPDMVVYSQGIEIGSARNRLGKQSGKQHVAIAFKHPQITGHANVLFANLGQMADQDDEDVFAIIMN